MGCAGSRSDQGKEEAQLVDEEHALGFHEIQAPQGHYVLMRYGQSGNMNSFAFKEAMNSMSIKTKNSSSHKGIEAFFRQFQMGNGVYNSQKLKLLNILLSTGTASEKAPILFEIYDPEFQLQITKSTVQTMISDLIDTSTAKISALKPDSNSSAITTYLNDIQAGRASAVDNLEREITAGQSSVTRSEFTARTVKVAQMFSSSGLRHYLGTMKKEGGQTETLKVQSIPRARLSREPT